MTSNRRDDDQYESYAGPPPAPPTAPQAQGRHERPSLPAPYGADKPSSNPRKKSLIKRFRGAIIFAILGVILLGIGLKLLPSRSLPPISPYNTVDITSPVPVTTVQYSVEQTSPNIAQVSISLKYFVQSNGSQQTIPPPRQDAIVSMTLPPGFHFLTCPPPSCIYTKPLNAYALGLVAPFTEMPVPFHDEWK